MLEKSMHWVTFPFFQSLVHTWESWNFVLWTRRQILNTKYTKCKGCEAFLELKNNKKQGSFSKMQLKQMLLSSTTANLKRKTESVCTVTSCVMQKIILWFFWTDITIGNDNISFSLKKMNKWWCDLCWAPYLTRLFPCVNKICISIAPKCVIYNDIYLTHFIFIK